MSRFSTEVHMNQKNRLINSLNFESFKLSGIDDFISETNPLNLDSVWEEADTEKKDWSRQATIKIFSDKRKFEEYQKTLNKSDSTDGV